jgi:hypothetical protein
MIMGEGDDNILTANPSPSALISHLGDGINLESNDKTDSI